MCSKFKLIVDVVRQKYLREKTDNKQITNGNIKGAISSGGSNCH